MHNRLPLWGGLIAAACSTNAFAQDPASPDATDARAASAGQIEEIVVTAQRREERLQDVPMALSAFSSDQIESRGLENLSDLNAIAPGLQISQTPSNTTISQISIRGVTQINPAIYWDPAVGVYVDGVYIGKSQGSIFNVVDLERIEVLRGPQGTLYGRNTLAGAINLVTRAPSGSFSGSASLEVGNYNAVVQRVSVDLPQIGNARISLAARSERRDGWVDTDRLSSRQDLNNRQNDGLRLAVDYDLSDSLLAEYRFDQSNVDQSNNFTQLYRIDIPFLQPFASTERQEQASVNAPSFEQARILGHSLTLTQDFNNGYQLKSITGYRKLEWNDSLDLDGSPLDVVVTQRFTDYDQLSQDLQFLGSFDTWNFVAGLYYFGDDGATDNPQSFFALDPMNAAYFDSRYATKTDAWSVYGQVDVRPLDPLTLTAGLRYTHEEKQLERAFGLRQNPLDPFFYIIPEGTSAEDTFSATTPMFSATWRFSDDVNVYARYAEGFKSGGFNGEFSQPPSGDPVEDIPALIALNIAETQTPFKPEQSQTFELGIKTQLADGRAQINAAVFHNKIDDLQTSIFLGSGAAATVIRNAGKATIQGLELETAFVLFPGTTLRANMALLDPEYDEYIDGGVDVADNRAFVHAPDYSYNVALDSELLRRSWGTLRAIVDYAYTDDFYTYTYQLDGSNPGAQVADNSQVKGHGLLNLRLAIVDAPLGSLGVGELALWARNALDEDEATNFIDFGPGFGNLTIANFVEPRTFGISGVIRW
ncbi:TonB-dependent receptor [Flagellatimonas centrodinii]|uniref:TonB-dependent receptor n=1 Tax=Flagellatimonas centrodinii TaxID=2806210 RepID=UPI001FED630E|nr:TonB-dependent receptor [Flagellatimonas centrodinii]ULQ47740.1 TonB-dependent receptor [Flagellatimonas centrodinii]